METAMLTPGTSHRYIVTVPDAPLFRDLARQWEEKDAPRLRESTLKEYRRTLRREVLPRIGDLNTDQIKRASLVLLCNDLMQENGAGVARNARAVINAIFNWAMGECLIEGPNPTKGIKLPRPKKRKRWLSEAELRIVWHACEDMGHVGRIVRLLILTGCRREEIAALRWDEMKGGQAIVLPGERTKNGREHVIHLSPLMLAQLPPRREGPFVFGPRCGQRSFTGWSYGEEELPRRIKRMTGGELPGGRWTRHDLRHTFSSHMREKRLAEPMVVESCLNHKEPGMAGHYNHARYEAEKRAAFEAWSREVARIVGERAV
jgi:integrase